jgi:hypothetical protein
LISWSYTLIINNHERYTYVKRRLSALNSSNPKGLPAICLNSSEDKRLFKKFVNNYLKEDGVLVLRLLSRNSQDLIVSEVISNLFNLYKNQVKQQKINLKTKNLTQVGHVLNLERKNPNNNINNKININFSNENELQQVIPGAFPKQSGVKNFNVSSDDTSEMKETNS